MDTILEFKDEYYFLSNFYPCSLSFDGINYKNSEAAFQAQKCVDPSNRYKFSNLSPSQAKSLGRRIALRDDWENIKDTVMLHVVYAKFYQNKELMNKLALTHPLYLIEGNTWNDKYWGIDLFTNEGENKLGKILMSVREDLLKDFPEYKKMLVNLRKTGRGQ